MAFHIFNISPDTPDAQPDHIPEDLSINDQESLIELIVEKVCGIDNDFEEHDEPDAPIPVHHFHISKSFKKYSVNENVLVIRPFVELDSKNPYTQTYYSQYVAEITPPPPKA